MSRIFITGDTHGSHDCKKLNHQEFKISRSLTKSDYVIVAGDWGGVWYSGLRDKNMILWYGTRKYQLLFVDGNHENFDALESYPVTLWNEGFVHQITLPEITIKSTEVQKHELIHWSRQEARRIQENWSPPLHLMRGSIYHLSHHDTPITLFVFGGGDSVDKRDRLPRVSWWPQEMPSDAEYDYAYEQLENHHWIIDYIVTHTAPSRFLSQINCLHKSVNYDRLTDFLNEVYLRTTFKQWFFGHFHQQIVLDDGKLIGLYHTMYEII
jgi:predicted phosphodiesterase